MARRLYLAHKAKQKNGYRLTVIAFVSVTILIVPLVLGVLFVNVKDVRRSILGGEDVPQYAYFGSGSKADFLRGLNLEQERIVRGQIDFIAEIIRQTRRSNPEDLAEHIVRESLQAGYDPFLVTAVTFAESTFNQRARSKVGALGLMQLLPTTAKYISKVDGIQWKGTSRLTSDPGYNLQLGIAYLKYLENYFDGDIRNILIAYNWGPGNLETALKKRKRIPGSPKTYAKKILTLQRDWTREFEGMQEPYKFIQASYTAG